jgi:hypothetical protein
MRAARLSLFQTFDCSTVVGFDLPPRRIGDLPAGNDDNIYIIQWFTASKELAHAAFCAVPHHRVPNLLAGRDTEPRRPDGVREGNACHESAPEADPVFVDLGKLRPTTQFHRGDETVNRFLPLARLRLSTIRPFFVDIRTRNP